MQIGAAYRSDGRLYLPLVSDAGLASLAAVNELQYLGVDNADITDDGLRSLAESPSIKSILFLRCPKLTEPWIARLRERLPHAVITSDLDSEK